MSESTGRGKGPGGSGGERRKDESPPTVAFSPASAWEVPPGRVSSSLFVPPDVSTSQPGDSPIPPTVASPRPAAALPPQTLQPQHLTALPQSPHEPHKSFGADSGKAAIHAAGFVARHFHRAFVRDMQLATPTDIESQKLTHRKVLADAVRRFLVWRRSWLIVLLPVAAFSAFLHILRLFDEGKWRSYTAFGTFVFVCYHVLTQLAFPLAATIAVATWDRSRLSRWVLIGGFVTSFVLPMALFLFPFHWWVKWESDIADVALFKRAEAGVEGAWTYFLLLLPTIMSLIPGVLRACTRIKSLLPESIVPGWFLVFSAPLYVLVLYLFFVVVNQVAGNSLLLTGMLLLMAAPAVYLTRLPILIRPITDQTERRQLDRLQLAYGIMLMSAMLFMLVYLCTAKYLNRPLVGHKHEAWIETSQMAWYVAKFLITYLSKSMFITAVAVDLFMLVNLSVWRNTRAFGGTPESEAYDQQMLAFGEVADGTPARPLPLGFTRELILGMDIKAPPFK